MSMIHSDESVEVRLAPPKPGDNEDRREASDQVGVVSGPVRRLPLELVLILEPAQFAEDAWPERP